ncbi:tRNA lysidine(34) synthetase TilS [Stakelama tenebrarum]|uniref:tRNA(Ile)-lysidine synthase n=1 Tax=Stakelama tenebrarum TaxID=2711215 RepID=A0A6G6Y1L5_9SPHN|nr:tRNA lysidine(34) synthetase TilS [Sphingosinithalassobacter tenebrarum]QIG78466.1 tRNA lysidine(34) synthetase TilS [Sphingosinithalassobacter tenebrarum]
MSRPDSPSCAAPDGEIASPDAARIARFRDDFRAVAGQEPAPAAPLGLAVSGGPDSVALLLLAAAAWPGSVHAATVDHRLRPESADEAAMVAALCTRIGVPHATLTRAESGVFAGNQQEAARTLRYTLLSQWAAGTGLLWVATAHQRDDIAETFLMRARRGAGVGGLAAMVPMRPMLAEDPASPLLVRPLLGWSRAELSGLARCAGAPFVTDRSNADPRYDRARIRRLIDESDDLSPGRLALAAGNLRHAEDGLEWSFARELPGRVSGTGADLTVDAGQLPYELRRRLARWAIDAVRNAAGLTHPWGDQGLDRFVSALDRGDAATLAAIMAHPAGDRWRFRMAPSRRSH